MAGRIELNSQIVKFERGIVKFERGVVLSAAAPAAEPTTFDGFLVNSTTLTNACGAAFLSESVGDDAPAASEQTNQIFLPLVVR